MRSQKINISSLLHREDGIEFWMPGLASPEELRTCSERVQLEVMLKLPQEVAAMGQYEACSPALHHFHLLESHQIYPESARGLEQDQQTALSTGSRNLRAEAGRKYSTRRTSTKHSGQTSSRGPQPRMTTHQQVLHRATGH